MRLIKTPLHCDTGLSTFACTYPVMIHLNIRKLTLVLVLRDYTVVIIGMNTGRENGMTEKSGGRETDAYKTITWKTISKKL